MATERKIRVKSALVELDGDEMTRVLWGMIKEQLLFPYLEMDLDYYDLHIKHRDQTNDQVTIDAAKAIQRHGVGVKCATITPNAARVKEYKLKGEWKSPNGTIRGLLDGTVFRAPIMVKNISPAVRNWVKPIYIGRHAYGDVYKNSEIRVNGPGKAEILFTPNDGAPVRQVVHEFQGPGILQGIHNTDDSIRKFARACFTFGYDQKLDIWFSAKDTISKTYDARFKQIFEEEYESHWKERFEAAGLSYFYTLIDDAVARIMKSRGGLLWACKNYDGDVMSDMLASCYGSLAMMKSVLVSPDGCFMFEAAHGTVQRHYYRYLKGGKTSTNPMALIFTWSSGIRKRGELDKTPQAVAFADALEAAAKETVESGFMTGDLVNLAEPSDQNRRVDTEEFIAEIKARLESKL
ncbi:MAG: NADP-dependent isocitrate dehydrogenase [Deltaproteobacteria bacterium]|nr:NADP-dependent isocitrate dehydrogenase [Deltaproteobacteria bacterium]MBW2136900.1 NADP-dependent isocitrate dehydrogenase [Deltaproteobacteria bacterium]